MSVPAAPESPAVPPTEADGAQVRRRVSLVPLITAGGLLLLGALTGVLWSFVTPYATVTVTADGLNFSAAQTGELFGAVAVFAFLAFGLGAICGLTVWFVLREARGLAGLGYAALVATVSGWAALQVAQLIADTRFPGVNPHEPGVYRLVGDLWMSDASLGSLPAPWLLIICSTGLAVVAYFVCIAGSSDAALPEAALQHPEVPEVPEVPTVGTVTAGDEEWRTRP